MLRLRHVEPKLASGVLHRLSPPGRVPRKMSPKLSANVAAFARLFEAVHEGVYIGTIHGPDTRTSAANPHLKLMFGYAADTPEVDVRPFEADRFLDPQARDGFIARLHRAAPVTTYLLPLPPPDPPPT